MNSPFLLGASQRLACWKQLRQNIQQAHHVDEKIGMALSWWQHAPLENGVIDWDNHAAWPDPWSLIHNNTYCTSAHSLGLAYTLMLADPDTFSHVQLVLIWEPDSAIQKIVVHTHDHYLNLGFVDKTPISQVKNAIKQHTWIWINKNWQTWRPK